MIGLIFFGFLLLWITTCVYVANCIGNRLPESRWRGWVKVAATIALVLSLVIDEIVGAWQFKNLCAEEAQVIVDPERARGRSVYLEDLGREVVHSTAVPIYRQRWRYLDTRTDEVVVAFTAFDASGGFFMRRFGTAEFDGPVVFDGYCAPADRRTVFERFAITKVQRQDVFRERKK